jgi:uncharacterized protein YndB with AHSA1/START domain
MNTIKVHRKILAPVATVWEVLLDPGYVQQWAATFSEGTWIEADWRKGGLVVWKDAQGNIAAKGLVLAFERNTLLEVGFFDDAQGDSKTAIGEYKEKYILDSTENKTLLTITAGPLPEPHYSEHSRLWEAAIDKIKSTAESA